MGIPQKRLLNNMPAFRISVCGNFKDRLCKYLTEKKLKNITTKYLAALGKAIIDVR